MLHHYKLAPNVWRRPPEQAGGEEMLGTGVESRSMEVKEERRSSHSESGASTKQRL